jgi:hypothetical protein
MAGIIVVQSESNARMRWYLAGVGEARKAVKKYLRVWKREQEGMGDAKPVLSIQRWEVKTGKAKLLEALNTGGVEAESAEAIECWSIDNDNKLFSWEGWLTDDPDLAVGEE